jgi:DNA helicase-2/ATP-dependent DNA helicase PcrA
MIEDVLDWAASIDVPDEHPGCGWGKWMTKMAFEREAPFLPDEDLQSLLLDLDGVAADDQDLARFLGQIEPLGKDLALCRTEGVRIMTMGGSKGLTVRAAILAGVENGVVPRLGCDLSEERRILYVAMTRAKEYLFCTWAARRSGPTARAGSANRGQRQVSHFLEGGPVESQDGVAYLKATEHKRVLP